MNTPQSFDWTTETHALRHIETTEKTSMEIIETYQPQEVAA